MNSRDTRNLAALALAQGANGAFPLFVAPYLLHTAGAEAYSRFAISEALAMGVLTIALYSFDLDAIGSVVGKDLRKDRADISRFFSEVLYARLAVFFIAVAIAVVLLVALDTALLGYFWGWMLFVLAQILLSSWLYQGIERNWMTAWCVVASRISAIAGMVWFIRSEGDVARVPTIIGVTSLASSVGLVSVAHVFFGIRLRVVPLFRLTSLLRGGWAVFLGSASVFMYRDANVLVLGGVLGDPAAIATYSLTEKVVKGIQAAVRPVNQLFLPKAIAVLKPYRRPEMTSLLKVAGLLKPQLVMVTLGVVIVWTLLIGLVRFEPGLMASVGLDKSVILVMIMSPAVLFGVANFMLGSVGLNHLAASRYLFFSIIATGLVNLVVCAFLSLRLGVSGAALAFVISEMVLFALVLWRYFRGQSSARDERWL